MKLKHYDHDGRARFVTFCTHRKIPVIDNDVFRAAVVSAIKAVRELYGLSLVAYVIMPEHIHLIVIPREDTKLGLAIGDLKRLSARIIHDLLKLSDSAFLEKLIVTRDGISRFALWQRRCYDHNIRSEESLWTKVEYCHRNPVRRALVSRPEAWKWSSSQFYAGYLDVPLEMDIIAVRGRARQ